MKTTEKFKKTRFYRTCVFLDATPTELYNAIELQLLQRYHSYGAIKLQLRRSGNIAEGCGRRTEKELVNFLGIALGSSSELESQCIVATDLGFLTEKDLEEIQSQITEIQKMLTKLMAKFKTV